MSTMSKEHDNSVTVPSWVTSPLTTDLYTGTRLQDVQILQEDEEPEAG